MMGAVSGEAPPSHESGVFCPDPASSYSLGWSLGASPPIRCEPIEGAPCPLLFVESGEVGWYRGTFQQGRCVPNPCTLPDGSPGREHMTDYASSYDTLGSTLACRAIVAAQPGDSCPLPDGESGRLNRDFACVPLDQAGVVPSDGPTGETPHLPVGGVVTPGGAEGVGEGPLGGMLPKMLPGAEEQESGTPWAVGAIVFGVLGLILLT